MSVCRNDCKSFVTHALCIYDLDAMNELIARVHVISSTVRSYVAIYANHAPRACDVLSPSAMNIDFGMSRYGTFE